MRADWNVTKVCIFVGKSNLPGAFSSFPDKLNAATVCSKRDTGTEHVRYRQSISGLQARSTLGTGIPETVCTCLRRRCPTGRKTPFSSDFSGK